MRWRRVGNGPDELIETHRAAGLGRRYTLGDRTRRPEVRVLSGTCRSQPAAQIVAHGLGVAVLPESVTMAHRDELRAIPLTQPRINGRLALAWRASGPVSPAAGAFISRARRHLPGATQEAYSPG